MDQSQELNAITEKYLTKDGKPKWPDDEKCPEGNQNVPLKREQELITEIAVLLKEAASLFNLVETQSIIRAQKAEIEGHKSHIARMAKAYAEK